MKRIVVLGAAESGTGAAILAKKEGYDVFVSDMSAIHDRYKKMLDDRQIEWEEGHHTEEKILNADEIIKSPGIPDTAPIIRKAIEKEPFGFEGDNMKVTVTTGAMKYSNGISLEKWVNQADEKMYSGKNSGKNKVVY